MPASITSNTRVYSALSFIENLDIDDIYLFAGQVSPWDDEDSPDVINDSYAEFRDIKNKNVFMKKATGADSFLGLKRFDWETGVVYTPWDDETDITDYRNWLGAMQPFYVFVLDASLGSIRYNVYICIDNAYGAESTVQPSGQSTAITTNIDGYRWKFMYSISDDILNYLNDQFIPCPHLDVDKTSAHLDVESNAIPGSIDRVKIINGGTGYTLGNTVVDVTGDGSSSVLSIELDVNGTIEAVNIINHGSNYSYADIIVSGDGVDAELKAVLSPYEGHGYDASLQLGASYVLYSGTFSTTEDGLFPTSGAYRRIGLINNTKDFNGNFLSGDKYDLTDQIDVNNVVGSFLSTQRIIGNLSGASAVLYYINGDTFYITDRKGNFSIGETIYLDTDPGVITTMTDINNNTSANKRVGDIIYYENTQFVVRKTGQSETFIFAIEF